VTPFVFTLVVLVLSALAGLVGSLLGLGGGMILVPVLTLVLGVDIRYAMGASIVSVIATSSGAAAGYVRERLTNIRVAMFLEVATTAGALGGAFVAGLLDRRALHVIFGLILALSALAMLSRLRGHIGRVSGPPPRDRWADRLRLHGTYVDEREGREVAYLVRGSGRGFVLMLVAGAMSGLLGVGSGVLKVPAMDLAMRLPIKVSAATSNFMIGVTAAATAGVYFARGDIDPFLAAPVACGVLVGALVGARLLPRVRTAWVRVAFVVVLVTVAAGMFVKGVVG
jgi:uncharacterized protein